MIHLTLNTGHVAMQPDVGPDGNFAMMRPLLGGGNLGAVAPALSAYRVVVTGDEHCAAYTVFRADVPIVTCALCWSAEAAEICWEGIETNYLRLSDRFPEAMAATALPDRPDELPWLAVLVLPTINLQPAEVVEWLGNFELCLAWAILEAVRGF